MKYNPAVHHRRSIRLKRYDYTKEGMYFITICCHQHKCWFGEIENENIILNDYGLIAHHQWADLSTRFSNIELDELVVMPNHMHGIIIIKANLPDNISSSGSGASPDPTNPNTKNPTIGGMVGVYKSLAEVGCLKLFESKNDNRIMGKLWQRNYYEHIIRNEQSFNRISEYIRNNPKNWQNDKFNK